MMGLSKTALALLRSVNLARTYCQFHEYGYFRYVTTCGRYLLRFSDGLKVCVVVPLAEPLESGFYDSQLNRLDSSAWRIPSCLDRVASRMIEVSGYPAARMSYNGHGCIVGGLWPCDNPRVLACQSDVIPILERLARLMPGYTIHADSFPFVGGHAYYCLKSTDGCAVVFLVGLA